MFGWELLCLERAASGFLSQAALSAVEFGFLTVA